MPSPTEPSSWWEGVYYDPLPVGGIAAALMLGTYALLQLPVSVPLLVAGGCGVALVYSVDRALVRSPEDAVNHPARRRWMQEHHRWLVGEAILLLLLGGGAVAYLRPATVLAAGGLSVFAGLHLLTGQRWGRPLNAFRGAKPLIVAGAWAIGGTLLPVLEAGRTLGAEEVLLTGYRLLFIMPNVLMTDWADRAGDAAAGLKTWTSGWTRPRLQVFLTVFLGLGIAGAIGTVWGGGPPLLLVDALGLLAMIGAVWTVRPGAFPQNRFLLDMLVAWPIIVWIGSLLWT